MVEIRERMVEIKGEDGGNKRKDGGNEGGGWWK